MGFQARALQAALKAMQVTRGGVLLAPATRGIGVIFTLHHVRPDLPADFAPNRILTITPDFLARTIEHVMDSGYHVVTLDDMARRLANAEDGPPFACFTFDDGYRDNREYALPVFERFGLPMAVYVAPELADGTGDLWWIALEEAIRRLDRVEVVLGGIQLSFPAGTSTEKTIAFEKVYWALRALSETETRAEVARLCKVADYDAGGLCRSLVMDWTELRELSLHPLVTLGAHTLGHWALAKLPEDEALRQIIESVARIAAETGRPCRHFSFPYGDIGSAGDREFALARAAGLATAVTTGKSLIHPYHGQRLTALPRLSLNGDYQDIGQLEVLLTGAPFALLDMVRSLSAPVRRRLARPASAASTR